MNLPYLVARFLSRHFGDRFRENLTLHSIEPYLLDLANPEQGIPYLTLFIREPHIMVLMRTGFYDIGRRMIIVASPSGSYETFLENLRDELSKNGISSSIRIRSENSRRKRLYLRLDTEINKNLLMATVSTLVLNVAGLKANTPFDADLTIHESSAMGDMTTDPLYERDTD